jgi:hypothetical protein
VTATATQPHPDRLTTREGTPAGSVADLDLAVEHLASLMAGTHGGQLSARSRRSPAPPPIVRAHTGARWLSTRTAPSR